MGTLELLDGLVKIDDAIQQGENFGRERGNVSHSVVVSIEDG